MSDEGKKLSAEAVIKELEVWHQKTHGDHVGLHGGIEIVDEVCMAVIFDLCSSFYDFDFKSLSCRFSRRYLEIL